MSHDDDDIDDQALRPLRSVWLAMPDEEPPTRGLDALLAAARVKADEMKASARAGDAPASDNALLAAAAAAAIDRPRRNDVVAADQQSLWARFVAAFLRPQVLALATIMILVGGAVFISQRRDKLQHEGPAVSAPE